MPRDSKKTHWAWDTRPWEGGRWAQDPDKPGKKGTSEPVHVGFKEHWDPNETARRKYGSHGRWTKPLIDGATKAKWGLETFNQGRYRCCDDLEGCGVPVKVVQGSVDTWHFKREWNYNQNKPSNCSGGKTGTFKNDESVFHRLTKMHIADILNSENKWKEGKKIKSAREEITATKDMKFEDDFSFRPDITVQHENGSITYVEIIYKNPLTRELHDHYQMNVVVINLLEEGCTESVELFDKWKKGGGIEKLLEHEWKKESRAKRFENRKLKWKHADEKVWRRSIDEEISRCREKFGLFTFEIDWKLIDALDEIEKLFQGEKIRREEVAERDKKMLEIMAQKAKDKEEAEKKRLADEKDAYEKKQQELRDRRDLVNSKNEQLNNKFGFDPEFYVDSENEDFLNQAYESEKSLRLEISKEMEKNEEIFGVQFTFEIVYNAMERQVNQEELSSDDKQKIEKMYRRKRNKIDEIENEVIKLESEFGFSRPAEMNDLSEPKWQNRNERSMAFKVEQDRLENTDEDNQKDSEYEGNDAEQSVDTTRKNFIENKIKNNPGAETVLGMEGLDFFVKHESFEYFEAEVTRRVVQYQIDENLNQSLKMLDEVKLEHPEIFDLIGSDDLQVISKSSKLPELKPPPQNQYYYRFYIDDANRKPVDKPVKEVESYLSNFHEHRIVLEQILEQIERFEDTWKKSIHADNLSINVDEICNKHFSSALQSARSARIELKYIDGLINEFDDIIRAILSLDATLAKGRQKWDDIKSKYHTIIDQLGPLDYLKIIGYNEEEHSKLVSTLDIESIQQLSKKYSREMEELEVFMETILSYHALPNNVKSIVTKFYSGSELHKKLTQYESYNGFVPSILYFNPFNLQGLLKKSSSELLSIVNRTSWYKATARRVKRKGLPIKWRLINKHVTQEYISPKETKTLVATILQREIDMAEI